MSYLAAVVWGGVWVPPLGGGVLDTPPSPFGGHRGGVFVAPFFLVLARARAALLERVPTGLPGLGLG